MDVAKEGKAKRRPIRSKMSNAVLEAPDGCKVYTPPSLASAIVKSLATKEGMTWLEPGCGHGSFLSALHQQGVSRDCVTGVEIDTSKAPADMYARVVRGIDFLDWSSEHYNEFDRVVGNPPYASIRFLSGSLRERAAQIVDIKGEAIGYRANIWYAFALESVRCLKPGGSMALILPASAEFSDYSEIGRRNLNSLFDRVDLIRSQSPLFAGVQEGSVILFARDKNGKAARFRRHVVQDLSAVLKRIGELSELPARKCPDTAPPKRSKNLTLFSDVMETRLGGVTGDAGYFLLSESERVSYSLPKRAFVRVVSRSHHVRNYKVSRKDWERLSGSNEKVWLFRPRGKIERDPTVVRYLKYGEEQGGCKTNAHKIVVRDPWYITPLPKVVDAFITGMSGTGFWLCMNEMSGLSATNTLYVARFIEQLTRAQRYAWAIALLTSTVVKQVQRATRVYPDGLKKIEPGQIAKLEIPTPGPISRAVTIYARICGLYLSGNGREASRIADKVIHASRS